MYCYQCGHPVSSKADRCPNCGANLSLLGPETLRQRFAAMEATLTTQQETIIRLQRFLPPVVADSVLYHPERLRGERRIVAVLFVDAVGFTRLSVSLDAEPMFNLINGLLTRLVTCVERYGGLVDKFMGDGLMAVFGAPVAHENDVELAVRAALDMQQAATEFAPIARAQLGAPLELRIGINCGPAVAGILETQSQDAYTVIGETVNLAARLEAMAAPSQILVSQSVYRQVHRLFRFGPQAELTVKGMDEPVTTYTVLGVSQAIRKGLRGIPAVSEVYLGRQQELRRLRALLKSFLQDRRGRVVVVTGDAGIGKSQLVRQWLAEADRGTLQIWQGQALPHPLETGYGVFKATLLDGIRQMEANGSGMPDIHDSLRPYLQRLLGQPLDSVDETRIQHLAPEQLNQLTVLAIRERLLTATRSKPLVMVLDDFHWADELSYDALQSLSSVISQANLLLCVIARTQERPLLALTRLDPDLYLELTVPPLSWEEARQLFGTYVDVEGFSSEVIKNLLKRAGGNPFFIQEFVRMLIEQGALELSQGKWRVVPPTVIEEIDLPTSLRTLMLARIDRLPDNLRQLLRDASVIGLQFTLRLLQEVERRLGRTAAIRPMLERLVELELLEPRSVDGEEGYGFTHILTQETIYQNILYQDRIDLHQVVAQSYEACYRDRLETQIESLALHYDRARRREKALLYMLRAGDRARQRYANKEAIEYYSRALQLSQLVTEASAERWHAALHLADVYQLTGNYDEAIALYQAILEEPRQSRADVRADIMVRLGRALDKRGELESARAWLEEAVHTLDAEGTPTPGIEAEIYNTLGWITFRSGDLPTARRLLEHAASLVEDTEHYKVLSSILNRLGAVYYSQGDWDMAMAVVQRALEIRERSGDLIGTARSLNNLGILKRDSGDWSGALQAFQRCLSSMEIIGDAEGIAIAHTNLANVHIDLGNWEQAESHLRRSYEIAQQIGNLYEQAQASMNLGHLFLRKGDWDEAGRYLNAALALYSQLNISANPNVVDAHWLRSVLFLEIGCFDEAIQWGARVKALLQEMTGSDAGSSPEWGRYYQLMGRLALTQDEIAESKATLDRAIAIFEETRNYVELARTLYWRAQTQLRNDDLRAARADLIRARELLQGLGACADLEPITRFLNGLDKAVAQTST